MRALTVIESEDGEVIVAGSDTTDTELCVELLHKGIEAIAKTMIDARGQHGDS